MSISHYTKRSCSAKRKNMTLCISHYCSNILTITRYVQLQFTAVTFSTVTHIWLAVTVHANGWSILSFCTIYIWDTIYTVSCQQGGRYPDCEWLSGSSDMVSSCEGIESAVQENQQGTVQRIRGWKECQLLTVWNQQYIQHFATWVLHWIQINHHPEAIIFQFIILTFVYSSTCFACFPAHHQKLNDCSGSLWFYLHIVVIAVLCSWSGRPETCWAVNKRQDNKLKNYCIRLVIYLNCTIMHGLTNIKFYI
jgi:hypothetical protein